MSGKTGPKPGTFHHSEETKQKLRLVHLGKKHSPERRARRSKNEGSPAWHVENIRLAHYPEERSRVQKSWFSWYLYGIVPQEEAQLYERQNGECLVCAKPLSGQEKNQWAVDHDGSTLRVRGLLHNQCNRRFLPQFERYGEAIARYLVVTPVDLLLEQHGFRSSVV